MMRATFTLFIAVLVSLIAASCSRPPETRYVIALPTATGLKEKAPISFGGLQVGYISDIRPAAPGSNGIAGLVVTGFITNPRMHVLAGDTARIITVTLLGDPQIEIVRASDSGPELPVGSTIVASASRSQIAILTNAIEAVVEFSRLPPDRQKQVAGQIRAMIESAKAGGTNNTGAGVR